MTRSQKKRKNDFSRKRRGETWGTTQRLERRKLKIQPTEREGMKCFCVS